MVEIVGMRLQNGWWPGLGCPVAASRADEHRELDDPHVAVRPLVHRRSAEVVAELAEHLARRGPLVGDDEHEVAGLDAEPLARASACSVVGEELGHRRVEPVGGRLQPHQALGAELTWRGR